MSIRDEEGLKLTSGRLGWFLSMVAALGILWQIAGYVKTQELTNANQDQYISENKTQMKDVVTQLQLINNQMSELITISKLTTHQSSELLTPRISKD